MNIEDPVLELLKPGEWVSTPTLIKETGLFRAQARIVELRKEWHIQSRKMKDSKFYEYRLVGPRRSPVPTKVAGFKVWVYDDGKYDVIPMNSSDEQLTEELVESVRESLAYRLSPIPTLFGDDE